VLYQGSDTNMLKKIYGFKTAEVTRVSHILPKKELTLEGEVDTLIGLRALRTSEQTFFDCRQ
jgi:hypothetical protein